MLEITLYVVHVSGPLAPIRIEAQGPEFPSTAGIYPAKDKVMSAYQLADDKGTFFTFSGVDARGNVVAIDETNAVASSSDDTKLQVSLDVTTPTTPKLKVQAVGPLGIVQAIVKVTTPTGVLTGTKDIEVIAGAPASLAFAETGEVFDAAVPAPV